MTEAAGKVGGNFDWSYHTYTTPSVVLKLGHLLKNVCGLEIRELWCVELTSRN